MQLSVFTVRGFLATQEFIVNFHQARDELLATRPLATSFFAICGCGIEAEAQAEAPGPGLRV